MVRHLLVLLARLFKGEKVFPPYEFEFPNGIKFIVHLKSKELEVMFKKENQIILDFQSLTSSNTNLIASMENSWGFLRSYQNKLRKAEEKFIVCGHFIGLESLLDFLHEAGHSNDELSLDLSWSAKMRHDEEISKDKLNAYPISRLRAMKEEREEALRSERNAWAYALRKARQLERQFGIKIFQPIGQVETIFNYINKCLDSYEKWYLNELYYLDIFTKEQMKKFFQGIA